MKHIHWAILTDDEAKLPQLQERLTAFAGTDVVASSYHTSLQKADVHTRIADANALYVSSRQQSVLPLCILALKKDIPVILHGPTLWQYDDMIRLLRTCQQGDYQCYVEWSGIDMGAIHALQHHQQRPDPVNPQAVQMLARYTADEEVWQEQVYRQTFFMQQLFGVAVDAVALQTQQGEYRSAAILFENQTLLNALWMPCHNGQEPMTTYNTFFDDNDYRLTIRPDGSIQIHDETLIPATCSLLQQITETLQGYNICQSTITNAATCAWILRRLNTL